MSNFSAKPLEYYDRWPEFKGFGIDGRNRQKACTLLNLEPPVRALTDADIGESLTSYIASVNVIRRHLTSSQAAVVALELEKQFAVENAANKKAGAEKGRQTQTERAKTKSASPINCTALLAFG